MRRTNKELRYANWQRVNDITIPKGTPVYI